MSEQEVSPVQRLRAVVEPTAQVSHAAHGLRHGCEDVSQMEWYLGGRVGCVGPLPGFAAASLYAVLEPSRVVEPLDALWTRVDHHELNRSRADAAGRFLQAAAPEGFGAVRAADLLWRAVSGLESSGHLLFAGWRTLGRTGAAFEDLWRGAVALREHRGAAHIAAWRSAGLAPAEILVLSEAWQQRPLGSQASAMFGWDDATVMAAVAAHESRRWLADGQITTEGVAARLEIEAATDRQEQPAVDALGADLGELETTLGRLISMLASG